MLKTLSGSSPIFALSNHTLCSQTQNGAAVPLMTRKSLGPMTKIFNEVMNTI
jgi:hypothetical protein